LKIRLSILGATGSVGGSAVSLVEAYPEVFSVAALAAGKNHRLLYSLIRRFRPRLAAVFSEREREALFKLFKEEGCKSPPQVETGDYGLELCALHPEADVVLSAVSGARGLVPAFAALRAGKKVALANKESLVMAGDLLGDRERALISPVDSEHSAIFQALGGTLETGPLRRILLTASGGPFRGYSPMRLKSVTLEEALSHPSWNMGRRITVDSATMLNKGFEVMEAHHLFKVPYERIQVLVHPESLVHSMLEYPDGSILAQLGPPDMRIAAAYALTAPKRLPLLEDLSGQGLRPLDFQRPLTFEEPDRLTFPALALAEEAGKKGGTLPAILNAADEEAVEAFLQGKIHFTLITRVLEESLSRLGGSPLNSLEDALEADKSAREYALSLMRKFES
jgi:1-deoxy-D-xylulose-5-phosphate reductoisomerase